MPRTPPDLTTPLSNDELDLLGDVLLNRFDDLDEANPGDEGILDVTELDGFLTAIVSVPVTILPSQWWPVAWGDYPPVFESEREVEQVYSWVFRHLNGIAAMLMEQADDFEPLFSEREVDGRTCIIVDEWCEGYMRGAELAQTLGAALGSEGEHLLQPIRAFTEAAGWPGHDLPDHEAIEELQQAIVPSVRALHAYWLQRRQDSPARQAEPYRREAPRVGRNDPCPCGSGKKFKKCCLH
ncbi:MAG: UPF0149 family protein [Lysobacterales bacterium]